MKVRCIIPNWCENRVHITGSKEDIAKLKALIGDTFDFDILIPMPKEIKGGGVGQTAGNTMVVCNPATMVCHLASSKHGGQSIFEVVNSKSDGTGISLAQAVVDGYEPCAECVPGNPVDEKRVPHGLDKSIGESIKLIDHYGYDNWYNWSIANWGTKWQPDVCVDFGDTWASANFDTAWSPPEPIYNKLVELFPDLDIMWHYNEPGCCFSGDFETATVNDFADPCECGDCEECTGEEE